MATPSADCASCLYYRPQTSFVDAYKAFDRSPPRAPIAKVLLDLRKEETKVQENEMELQIELLRTEQKVWPSPPRFAPLCVFSGALYIPAAKNPNGGCRDIKPALNRQGRACRTCRFVTHPETRIGDRAQQPTGGGGPQETAFYRQVNKEQEDADATAQAMEIEQSFYSDGRLPIVSFLPTCAVLLTEGARHVTPFCNLRQSCAEHRPLIPVPPVLLERIGSHAQPPDERAVEFTETLARLVAASGAERPAEFMKSVEQWAGKDKTRGEAIAWASTAVMVRWAQEAPEGTDGKRRTSRASPETVSPATLLWPVVAGCDAFEWGIMAAQSHTSDAAATAAARAICQQLAEFIVTVPSPLLVARCVEAAITLLQTKGLFAAGTLERVESFMRRLDARAKTMRLESITDLEGYFEDFLGRISYPVGAWLHLKPRDAQRFAEIDLTIADEVRQRVENKRREARDVGAWLLELCAALDAGTLPPAERRQALGRIEAANVSGFERDREDEKAAFKAQFGRLAGPIADMVRDADVGADVDAAVEQASGGIYGVGKDILLPRRRVASALLLSRGTMPVTPTSLELLGREPRPGRMPESIEDALWEPTAKTLEALHAGRFGPPAEGAHAYLAQVRRIAAPYFGPATGATDGTSEAFSPQASFESCPRGHGPLRSWSGTLMCWKCDWPKK
jgi:hypothetical protein